MTRGPPRRPRPPEPSSLTYVISLKLRRGQAVLIAEIAHQFKELADNAPVMIWRAGPDKLCDFFNKPWLDFTGRTLEQEIGNG